MKLNIKLLGRNFISALVIMDFHKNKVIMHIHVSDHKCEVTVHVLATEIIL